MKKILIISKDYDMQGSISAVNQISTSLEAQIVGCAENHNQAVDIIKKEMPDLILCDLSLNGGFDGVALLQKLGKKYLIPIILIAESMDAQVMGKVKDLPIVGFLTKPFIMDQLKITLTVSLGV